MKKTLIIMILCFALIANTAFAKDNDQKDDHSDGNSTILLISPNIIGPLVGLVEVGFEFPVGVRGLSVEIKPVYFNALLSPIIRPLIEDSGKNIWFAGAKIGLNYYFSQDACNGSYLGAYLEGAYLEINNEYEYEYGYGYEYEYETEQISTQMIGGGLRTGYRWVWNWFSLGLNGRVSYNRVIVSTQGLFDDIESSDSLLNFDGFSYGVWFDLTLAITE